MKQAFLASLSAAILTLTGLFALTYLVDEMQSRHRRNQRFGR